MVFEDTEIIWTQIFEEEGLTYSYPILVAGVWANHAEQMGILEAGDIEEALNAASANANEL